MQTEKIYIHQRVYDYQRTLPPETRRAAKAALLSLPQGDTKPLTGQLEGFHRLRVGRHRFIYRYHQSRIRVFFAAPRAVVYEFLAAHLKELLG